MKRLLPLFLLACVALPAAARSWPLSTYDWVPGQGSGPSISAGGGEFLATWQDYRSPVRAARLDGDGKVLDPIGFPIGEDGVSPTRPFGGSKVVWVGDKWLVIFAEVDTIAVARVFPGTSAVAGPILRHASRTDDRPYIRGAIACGNRVLVIYGYFDTSYLILDESGNVVVAPRQNPKSSPGGATVATDGKNFLLIDGEGLGSTGLLMSLIAPDGTLIVRKALQLDTWWPSGELVSTVGGDFLLVLNYRDRIQYWRMSASTLAVESQGNATTDANDDSRGMLLVPHASGTEIIYVGGPSGNAVKRVTLHTDGTLEPRPFALEGNPGGMTYAASAVGHILVTNAGWMAVRAAPSFDAIPSAEPTPLTLAVPGQYGATRLVRNGKETLILWEDAHYPSSIFATTVDDEGRPRSGPPIELVSGGLGYGYQLGYLAVAGDGNGTYLFGKYDPERYKPLLRRLGRDLQWLDAEWRDVLDLGPEDCGYVREGSIAWDGTAWWIGTLNCFSWQYELAPHVQRLDAQLRPLTGRISVGTDETPYGNTNVRLVVATGDLFVFWIHDPNPPSGFPVPVPYLDENRLLASRVSKDGALLSAGKLISGSVSSEEGAIASNGSEMLVVWSTEKRRADGEIESRGVEATRLTTDLVPLDARSESGIVRGTVLDTRPHGRVDLEWDGLEWVVVSHVGEAEFLYPSVGRLTYRRFPSTGDLVAAWSAGQEIDLGNDLAIYDGCCDPRTFHRLAAGSAGTTVVLQHAVSSATSGVPRYVIHTIPVEPPRRRGVRR